MSEYLNQGVTLLTLSIVRLPSALTSGMGLCNRLRCQQLPSLGLWQCMPMAMAVGVPITDGLSRCHG